MDLTAQVPETNSEAPATEDASQEGERLYAGKYKSVEEFEKGYGELSKKLREKTPVVPDQYDFTPAEGERTIAADDPRLPKMAEVFKRLGLTQEQAKALVIEYAGLEAEAAGNPEEVAKAELAKLGEQAPAILGNVKRFFDANKSKFTPEQQAELDILKGSAAGIQALSTLIGLTQSPRVAKVDAPAEPQTTEQLTARLKELGEKIQGGQYALTAEYDRLLLEKSKMLAAQKAPK